MGDFPVRPAPDFSRLERVLRRDGEPDRVPFCEFFHTEVPVLQALGLPTPAADSSLRGRAALEAEIRQQILFKLHLGYDSANLYARQFGFSFPTRPLPHATTTEGERHYYPGDFATIANREDFERYLWPDAAKMNDAPLEVMEEHLPSGMKAVVIGPGGVLENVLQLLGYQNVSLMLYDDEEFVARMFETVGRRILGFFEAVAGHEAVGGCVLGDDMGFRTQTMLSPDAHRKYVLPWHQRIVEAVHRHGKLTILHSCGQLRMIWDDVLECGWDAKHSFEDAIWPVWEAKAACGDRVALLGGFDLDKLCRMSVEEVRKHTRLLIERCAPGGGWALGTGNSVPNYVPVQNYLAMLAAGWEAGKY